jgi:hypothetical protein
MREKEKNTSKSIIINYIHNLNCSPASSITIRQQNSEAFFARFFTERVTDGCKNRSDTGTQEQEKFIV